MGEKNIVILIDVKQEGFSNKKFDIFNLIWIIDTYSGGRKYVSPTKVMSDVLAILITFQIEFRNKWYIIGKP